MQTNYNTNSSIGSNWFPSRVGGCGREHVNDVTMQVGCFQCLVIQPFCDVQFYGWIQGGGAKGCFENQERRELVFDFYMAWKVKN